MTTLHIHLPKKSNDSLVTPLTVSQRTSPENLERKYQLYSKETLLSLANKGDFRAKAELKRRG